MPDPSDVGNKEQVKMNVTDILRKLNDEQKKSNSRITLLENEQAKGENQSEACIIMIMQLEVAFLLVNKMFENGLFKNLKFDKKDFVRDNDKEE